MRASARVQLDNPPFWVKGRRSKVWLFGQCHGSLTFEFRPSSFDQWFAAFEFDFSIFVYSVVFVVRY